MSTNGLRERHRAPSERGLPGQPGGVFWEDLGEVANLAVSDGDLVVIDGEWKEKQEHTGQYRVVFMVGRGEM